MKGEQRTINHSMHGVFVFVLLGMFAVVSTLIVLLGAQMYRNTVDRAASNNEDRVLAAYVRSMVRAEDADRAVTVEPQNGITTLALREDLDGTPYVTWLYCYQDQLYEQFTSEGDDFDPEDGTAICPALGFEPRIEGGLLTVNLKNGNGKAETVRVALRCAR